MFSMEDRRGAVDLYFTEGMTIRKVVAKLGYPSEGALAKWVREDPRYTGVDWLQCIRQSDEGRMT